MKENQIPALRHSARKLVRELGILNIDIEHSKKTAGEWHALIEVSRAPGLTISELGKLLLMTLSTTSRLVKSLVNHGFFELREGSDKRERSLYLTKAGEGEIIKIDHYSDAKIIGAFEFLTKEEIDGIIHAISRYGEALEQSRKMREEVSIHTLSTSRALRKQIVNMISDIQLNEFQIPITKETNAGMLNAEEEYYYNNSCNFWYAVNDAGKIIGSIGLKNLGNGNGEIKKLFVVREYRGKGVAQRLMETLMKAASKHRFKSLFLGTVDTLKAAHNFYRKYDFVQVNRKELPSTFEVNPLDHFFFRKKL